MKIITVDGISCSVGDGNDGEIILRHISKLQDSVATLTKDGAMSAEELAKLKKEKAAKDEELVTVTAAKDAEIAALKQKVADSALTPAKLDTLVKDRALMLGKAKAVLGDVAIADKTDGEIRRLVVDKKMGDKAKGWTDDQIVIGFDALTSDIKVDAATTTHSGFQDLRTAVADGGGAGDLRKQADTTIAARDARLTDAWKSPAHKA